MAPPTPEPAAPAPRDAVQPPPQPPGPEASREEWHAWRHQQRDYTRAQWRQRGWYGGGWPGSGWHWFWPGVLIVLGVYFLLSNLGLLWWLRGDIFWPVVLILLGLWLLLSRGRWSGR